MADTGLFYECIANRAHKVNDHQNDYLMLFIEEGGWGVRVMLTDGQYERMGKPRKIQVQVTVK